MLTVPCFPSLFLDPRFNFFRATLERSLSNNGNVSQPLNRGAVRAALTILRGEPYEGGESIEDEGRVEETNKDTELVHKTGQPLSPELIGRFRTLVENAINEFGDAPRDVYNGVFDLPDTLQRHNAALRKLNYTQLETLVRKFCEDHELDGISHRVVKVYPRRGTPHSDQWGMDFKSFCIGKKVVQAMRLIEEQRLRRMYDEFHRVSDSAVMAGWIFESIIHRLLIHGWRESDGSTPVPTLMTSNGKAAPTFTYSPSNMPLPPEIPRPLRIHRRNVTQIDLKGTLDDVTLAKNEYYLPTMTNNPLFDSFTIDYDNLAVRISVFQISSAQEHKGSDKGYKLIERIKNRVQALLMENVQNYSIVKTTVTYFLLYPKDEASPGTWKMPEGWNKNAGLVFCVPIPTSGTQCLSIPNFSA